MKESPLLLPKSNQDLLESENPILLENQLLTVEQLNHLFELESSDFIELGWNKIGLDAKIDFQQGAQEIVDEVLRLVREEEIAKTTTADPSETRQNRFLRFASGALEKAKVGVKNGIKNTREKIQRDIANGTLAPEIQAVFGGVVSNSESTCLDSYNVNVDYIKKALAGVTMSTEVQNRFEKLLMEYKRNFVNYAKRLGLEKQRSANAGEPKNLLERFKQRFSNNVPKADYYGGDGVRKIEGVQKIVTGVATASGWSKMPVVGTLVTGTINSVAEEAKQVLEAKEKRLKEDLEIIGQEFISKFDAVKPELELYAQVPQTPELKKQFNEKVYDKIDGSLTGFNAAYGDKVPIDVSEEMVNLGLLLMKIQENCELSEEAEVSAELSGFADDLGIVKQTDSDGNDIYSDTVGGKLAKLMEDDKGVFSESTKRAWQESRKGQGERILKNYAQVAGAAALGFGLRQGWDYFGGDVVGAGKKALNKVGEFVGGEPAYAGVAGENLVAMAGINPQAIANQPKLLAGFGGDKAFKQVNTVDDLNKYWTEWCKNMPGAEIANQPRRILSTINNKAEFEQMGASMTNALRDVIASNPGSFVMENGQPVASLDQVLISGDLGNLRVVNRSGAEEVGKKLNKVITDQMQKNFSGWKPTEGSISGFVMKEFKKVSNEVVEDIATSAATVVAESKSDVSEGGNMPNNWLSGSIQTAVIAVAYMMNKKSEARQVNASRGIGANIQTINVSAETVPLTEEPVQSPGNIFELPGGDDQEIQTNGQGKTPDQEVSSEGQELSDNQKFLLLEEQIAWLEEQEKNNHDPLLLFVYTSQLQACYDDLLNIEFNEFAETDKNKYYDTAVSLLGMFLKFNVDNDLKRIKIFEESNRIDDAQRLRSNLSTTYFNLKSFVDKISNSGKDKRFQEINNKLEFLKNELNKLEQEISEAQDEPVPAETPVQPKSSSAIGLQNPKFATIDVEPELVKEQSPNLEPTPKPPTTAQEREKQKVSSVLNIGETVNMRRQEIVELINKVSKLHTKSYNELLGIQKKLTDIKDEVRDLLENSNLSTTYIRKLEIVNNKIQEQENKILETSLLDKDKGDFGDQKILKKYAQKLLLFKDSKEEVFAEIKKLVYANLDDEETDIKPDLTPIEKLFNKVFYAFYHRVHDKFKNAGDIFKSAGDNDNAKIQLQKIFTQICADYTSIINSQSLEYNTSYDKILGANSLDELNKAIIEILKNNPQTSTPSSTKPLPPAGNQALNPNPPKEENNSNGDKVATIVRPVAPSAENGRNGYSQAKKFEKQESTKMEIEKEANFLAEKVYKVLSAKIDTFATQIPKVTKSDRNLDSIKADLKKIITEYVSNKYIEFCGIVPFNATKDSDELEKWDRDYRFDGRKSNYVLNHSIIDYLNIILKENDIKTITYTSVIFGLNPLDILDGMHRTLNWSLMLRMRNGTTTEVEEYIKKYYLQSISKSKSKSK